MFPLSARGVVVERGDLRTEGEEETSLYASLCQRERSFITFTLESISACYPIPTDPSIGIRYYIVRTCKKNVKRVVSRVTNCGC